jgi:SAM-dependent methyltransferase
MHLLRSLYSVVTFLGIDPLRFWQNMRGLGWFWANYRAFKRKAGSNPAFPIRSFYVLLGDRKDSSGSAKGHYFHQDLLVAQRIFANNPARHVDIGSRVDGFVAHVASFRPIEVFDIRPLADLINNVQFTQADLMQLDEQLVGYTDSLSCLHTIEHFGLGRYGDPIDPNGYLKGLQNLGRILQSGGTFYFSTPIGPQRTEFNAHRVFSVAYLLELFRPDYELLHVSYVDDKGDLHRHINLTEVSIQSNFGCRYGCGIFELRKK